MRDKVIKALCRRDDRYAAQLLKDDPSIIDEEIIDLAMDNGCVAVIRYLRENDLINAEERIARNRERDAELDRKINELKDSLSEVEPFFDLL